MNQAFPPGDHTVSITVGELQRTYVVHVPPAYDGRKAVPLLVMFHGGGGTAKAAMTETGWSDKADREGFIAAFPEATPPDLTKQGNFRTNPQTWNDGSGRFPSGQRNIDDVGFTSVMLDDLTAKFRIDPRRVYATGFSNGSSMTYRVGIELGQRFAAIAPVSGHLWYAEFKLSRPVPMVYIIGNEDPLNPPAGGLVTALGSTDMKPSILEEVPRWAQALGCTMTPETILDRDGVKAVRYANGRAGSEVVFYRIDGMGHTWPGGKSLLAENLVGKTSDKLNANDVIWEFFEKHPMPR